MLPNPERRTACSQRIWSRCSSPVRRTPSLVHGTGARVFNAKTQVVAERESSSIASHDLSQTVVIQLAGEPSGGYDLISRCGRKVTPPR